MHGLKNPETGCFGSCRDRTNAGIDDASIGFAAERKGRVHRLNCE